MARNPQQQTLPSLETLALMLGNLAPDELMWIRYCLHHNTQVLSAVYSNPTAQSLYRKGLIEEGSGHILELPFRIPDPVWHYLVEHKSEFLPDSEVNHKRFASKLENFRQALRPRRTVRPTM